MYYTYFFSTEKLHWCIKKSDFTVDFINTGSWFEVTAACVNIFVTINKFVAIHCFQNVKLTIIAHS